VIIVQQGRIYLGLKFHEFLINTHGEIALFVIVLISDFLFFFIFNIKNTLTLSKDPS